MDFSIIKSIHQSASRDGLDLTINSFPTPEFDRTYTRCTNNNFNIIPSCSRLSPTVNSDLDEPMDFDGRKPTVDIIMPTRNNSRHISNTIALQKDSTKLKLKFSVDRILGRDTDSSSRTSQDSGFNQHMLHDNCVDCNETSGRRDNNEMSTNSSALYSTPFSVASMLGFSSSTAASVVRPLAMRYLQRSPPIVGKDWSN